MIEGILLVLMEGSVIDSYDKGGKQTSKGSLNSN